MKFTTAYYLILLYTIVMIKPLIPMVFDAWAHTFAEAEHITNEHLKYGENHLEKEIAGSHADGGKSKDQNTVKSQDSAEVHLKVSNYKINLRLPAVNQIRPSWRYTKIPLVYILKDIPPPKFLSPVF